MTMVLMKMLTFTLTVYRNLNANVAYIMDLIVILSIYAQCLYCTTVSCHLDINFTDS
jgi:hypothetical protein